MDQRQATSSGIAHVILQPCAQMHKAGNCQEVVDRTSRHALTSARCRKANASMS
jgi:hypothetical protein